MKILLISNGRCGSHSVLEWLSENLNLGIITELEDNNLRDDFVVKRSPDNVNDINQYDFVIKLYRENVISCSESNHWAINHHSWHTNYEIPYEYLVENNNEIKEMVVDFTNENEKIRNIDVGLLVTYEEIFMDKTGEEKMENHINFKSKIKLDTDIKKTRKLNLNRSTHITYQLIIEDLLRKNKELLIMNEKLNIKDVNYQHIKTKNTNLI